MKLLEWLLHLVRPCTHVYAYEKTIDDHNLRAGFRHRSAIYRCVYCGAIKTVEQHE